MLALLSSLSCPVALHWEDLAGSTNAVSGLSWIRLCSRGGMHETCVAGKAKPDDALNGNQWQSWDRVVGLMEAQQMFAKAMQNPRVFMCFVRFVLS